MCTLIVGNGVLGPGTVVIAANRDESRERPSDPPMVLHEHPRVVGGRDRVAGGTWLAVRERRSVVALLNRSDRGVSTAASPEAPNDEPAAGQSRDLAEDSLAHGQSSPLRSRGLITLEVAAVEEGSPGAALLHAVTAMSQSRYAPFSLTFLSPNGCWVLYHTPGEDLPGMETITIGWHVMTHGALDDPQEPRTQRLLRELSGWSPGRIDEASSGLLQRLALHAESGGKSGALPAVCIHAGHMVTVSSSLVFLSHEEARYLHLEGRPCERRPADVSTLLQGDLASVHAS